MRLNIKLLISAVAAALIIASSSCSSSRKAASSDKTDATTQTQQPKSKAPAKRFEISSQIAQNYGEWSDLYAPMSVKLQKPLKINVSGRATMVRGQAVNISLRLLGIEIAVAYIDSDSAFFLDKLHKYVCKLPISSITENHFGISDLQDMMLGRAFFPGKGTLAPGAVTETYFSVQPTDKIEGGSILYPRKVSSAIQWDYIVDSTPKLAALEVSVPERGELTVSFSDIVNSVIGDIATHIGADGSVDKLTLDADIFWELGKAKFNEGRTLTPPQLRGYKEVTVEQLISILKQM